MVRAGAVGMSWEYIGRGGRWAVEIALSWFVSSLRCLNFGFILLSVK